MAKYVGFLSKNANMGIATLQKNKGLLGLAALISTVTLIFLSDSYPRIVEVGTPPLWTDIVIKPQGNKDSDIEEWWMLRKNMSNLSKLGEILFLQVEEPRVLESHKKYKILMWKYGSTIENRHLKHFSGQRIDPFEHCPVKNCDITYKDSDLSSSDIVIFHLHRMQGLKDLPKKRNPKQIWAFLTDESPYNTFLNGKDKLKDFNGIFNWSMSYRIDSDIPVPYGRTVLKVTSDPKELRINKRRDVLVAVMGSNCGGQNHRWKYIKELQKYIQVDVYGGCGAELKNACPGHFKADCPAIGQYLFYLSFENSNCDQYITEKLWWNAFQKNSIPVVMGSSPTSYQQLLPIDSYINVDSFANPHALAQYLLRLNKTEEFKRYYDWKRNFEVLNEHGYFQSKSYHYCRVCQALNYNAKDKKVYSDLEKFSSTRKDCLPAWDSWSD